MLFDVDGIRVVQMDEVWLKTLLVLLFNAWRVHCPDAKPVSCACLVCPVQFSGLARKGEESDGDWRHGNMPFHCTGAFA